VSDYHVLLRNSLNTAAGKNHTGYAASTRDRGLLAFPDGSMTASGLRREAARGRLVIERVAGKDFTTLANTERMRELCRVQAKDHDSICAGHAQGSGGKPCGLSATGNAISPRDALEARLTKGLRKMRNEH
jgi:hypothetical protein